MKIKKHFFEPNRSKQTFCSQDSLVPLDFSPQSQSSTIFNRESNRK